MKTLPLLLIFLFLTTCTVRNPGTGQPTSIRPFVTDGILLRTIGKILVSDRISRSEPMPAGKNPETCGIPAASV